MAFLMNEVSMKQNQTKQDDEDGDQGHYSCGSNDRIVALCIETCGVIMSSFQSDVSSKVNIEYRYKSSADDDRKIKDILRALLTRFEENLT